MKWFRFRLLYRLVVFAFSGLLVELLLLVVVDEEEEDEEEEDDDVGVGVVVEVVAFGAPIWPLVVVFAWFPNRLFMFAEWSD